ncbi:MAG: S-adenosylmethionine decarboxylase [bacterium]
MLINETIRLFSIDLRDYVEKLWDEDVPVIRHMVVEAVGVSEEMLGNSGVSKKMVGVCDKLGFHIIKTYKHLFTPQGISLVFILKESHLAIHTWPGHCRGVFPIY